jgi:SnoaL-like domain
MIELRTDWRTRCNEWLDAWTGNKPEKLLSFYTDDVFYLDPANPDGLHGREELLTYFSRLLSRNPDWRWEAVELFDTEPGFTLKWKAIVPVKETVLVMYGLDIVEMRGQLICRNEVYFDRVKWLELIKTGGL